MLEKKHLKSNRAHQNTSHKYTQEEGNPLPLIPSIPDYYLNENYLPPALQYKVDHIVTPQQFPPATPHRFVKTPVPLRSPSSIYFSPSNFKEENPKNNSLIPSPLQTEPYSVSIVPQEYLFNRLQWYYVTITFKNEMGQPIFVGYTVQFDHNVSFVDGRRRANDSLENQEFNEVIYLSIVGLCNTTRQALRKCARCKEKDKTRIKRKRKRDSSLSWNDTDEDNNNKFVQVLTSGNEKVDSDGQIKLRLRVACCVGVNKQHHMNHISSVPNSNEKEIHKGCDGMSLHLFARGSGYHFTAKASSQPIRVLGKVTATDRQKFSEISSTSSVTVIPSNIHLNIEPQIQLFEDTEPSNGSNVIPIIHELKPNDSVDPMWLFTLAPPLVEPTQYFHEIALQYQSVFEAIFPTSLTSIYDPNFFTLNNYKNIDPESPKITEIYSILAAGSCKINLSLIEPLVNQTLTILEKLNTLKLEPTEDAFLIASSFNRTAMYFGAVGDIDSAKSYNQKALSSLEKLASLGIDVTKHPVYEKLTWLDVTFRLDLETLENAYKWSKAQGKFLLHTYILFLIIATLSDPDLKTKNFTGKKQPIQSGQRVWLVNLFSQLQGLITDLKHHEAVEGKRTYEQLIFNGLEAMKNWVSGNYEKAVQHLNKTAIQAALLKHPRMEAFIPLYLASLCAVQLSSVDFNYVDVAELLIGTLLKIHIFRWARSLVDYLINVLESYTGKLEWLQG